MILRILPDCLSQAISREFDIRYVTEIRIRLNKPVFVAINGVYVALQCKEFECCTQSLLQEIVACASQNSLYAYNDEIVNGYIPCVGGIRVGVIGEAITTKGSLSGIKNISSLCIRLPRQIKGICDKYIDIFEDFDNTLILSRAGIGKTTTLREVIRLLSNNGYNVLVMDERYEISGSYNGSSEVDLGMCSDVCVGMPKSKCYGNIIRTMRPDIIATDEVFGEEEINAISDIIRCGVKVVATAHCESFESFVSEKKYAKLLSNMRYLILLHSIGNVDTVYDRKKNICII